MIIPGKDDLIKQLEEITARKPEINIQEAEIIVENKTEKNPEDFDYTKLEDLGADPEPENKEQSAEYLPPPPPVVIRPFSEYKAEALALVEMFNGISNITLPYLYRKKLLNKEEYLIAKTLRARLKKDNNAETSFSESEFDIYQKLMELSDYEESINFTEKETELIAQPLAEVMQKAARKTSPEMRLILALGTVTIPRMLVFFGSH